MASLVEMEELRQRLIRLKSEYPLLTNAWIGKNVLGVAPSTLTRYVDGTATIPQIQYQRILAFIEVAEEAVGDSDYWNEDGFTYEGMKAIRLAQLEIIEQVEEEREKLKPKPKSTANLPDNLGLLAVKKDVSLSQSQATPSLSTQPPRRTRKIAPIKTQEQLEVEEWLKKHPEWK